MSDYNKMRDGSREYQLGRQGRTPYDLDNWSAPAIADYNEGKADAAKLRRRHRRKTQRRNLFEILVGIPAAIVALLGAFVGLALLAALPVIIVLVVAKVLFF